ncbi:hypothetical protein ZIOFF_011154 [Zingiber officinale]|uniref:Protein kinase domain-containing protein n=1 Tax=Zingiber officinale TaxID=94328 RepID=A0A8J5LZ96_ZINOF|nr:hypothetical protein ZIOFF_011154 [Zingiber officinale]
MSDSVKLSTYQEERFILLNGAIFAVGSITKLNLRLLASYDLYTIKATTNDFSDENKLGEGGFGVVYKDELQDGQKIAAKKLLRYSSQGEFQNELSLIAKLEHINLVRVLGFYVEEDKLLIILAAFIFG